MSGDISSMNETTQDNEMLFRLIAYNAYRIRVCSFDMVSISLINL